MVSVENVSKSFKKNGQQINAVNQFSFTLHPGEVVGLIGPNGAGKSTLLRMIATLVSPSNGRILVNNLDTETEGNQVRKHIGYVAVETSLYEQMTPHDLLLYFGQISGLSKQESEIRISQLANQLGFDKYLHRKINGFSTGMKQKISIARGFIHRPSLMILDEPTNGLDLVAAHQVRDVIKTMRELNTSILVSTHIIGDIELCDRLLIMNEGRLIYENSVPEVLKKYTRLEDLFFDVTTHGLNTIPTT